MKDLFGKTQEQAHEQENLSHLVNRDRLLGKFNGSTTKTLRTQKKSISIQLLPIQTPSQALSVQKLIEKLPAENSKDFLENQIHSKVQKQQEKLLFQHLHALLALFTEDVFASRDRLLALNPGRRKMVEHRIEYIARKIARERGEKIIRPIVLTEILRESYRDASEITSQRISSQAWKVYATEVGLYHLLEFFFLKCLEQNHWRAFECADLHKMNFESNLFLSQKGFGFAHDKHAWNFVRSNIYSWHTPSTETQSLLKKEYEKIVKLEQSQSIPWTYETFIDWFPSLLDQFPLDHFHFFSEYKISEFAFDLLEKEVGFSWVKPFQDTLMCSKVFFPTLECGSAPLEILKRLFKHFNNKQFLTRPDHFSHQYSQVCKAIWCTETESFEVFWTEVLALLEIIPKIRNPSKVIALNAAEHEKVPNIIRVVQNLGLELHNVEQLYFSNDNPYASSKAYQGAAAQIQQIENFELAFVLDHIDRSKSSKWVKALVDQLPYWRNHINSGTNLNWGELHLILGLSKVQDQGYCIYLSHRPLPDGGDGEKLRKYILNNSTLMAFIDCGEEKFKSYRYLYIFKKSLNKTERDLHKPRFGKLEGKTIHLTDLEEANSSQQEIQDRGWDHLFVRGAAPVIRHLNHKWSKLFQFATIQSQYLAQDHPAGDFLANPAAPKAIQAVFKNMPHRGECLRFSMVLDPKDIDLTHEKFFIFPHNPNDLCWIECLLNSPPLQFWIKHQLLNTMTAKNHRFHDLRLCPIIDLSSTPRESFLIASEWIQKNKKDLKSLREWLFKDENGLSPKVLALCKSYETLERILLRYRSLFSDDLFHKLRPDAVSHFYPQHLLIPLQASVDVRIQILERNRSVHLPENWIIQDLQFDTAHYSSTQGVSHLYLITQQGPQIHIQFPSSTKDFLIGQCQALLNRTWGEFIQLLRIPKDLALFQSQVHEITRVIRQTAQEKTYYEHLLEEASLNLFEIPKDLRQFLPI